MLFHPARGQLQRDRLPVTELPHLSVGIPLPTRLRRPFSHGPLGHGDTHPDTLMVGVGRPGRFPVALRAQEFHRLEPRLPLRIVAIADADEAVPILRE